MFTNQAPCNPALDGYIYRITRGQGYPNADKARRCPVEKEKKAEYTPPPPVPLLRALAYALRVATIIIYLNIHHLPLDRPLLAIGDSAAYSSFYLDNQ